MCPTSVGVPLNPITRRPLARRALLFQKELSVFGYPRSVRGLRL
jgi:hypothetical protein